MAYETTTVAVSCEARTAALGAPTLNSAEPVIENGGVSVTDAAEALVMVTVDDAEPPSGTAPKSIVVGLSVIPGAPDPFNPTARVPPLELVMVKITASDGYDLVGRALSRTQL